MEKGDTISTYLKKLTTCKDELGSVGITTVDDDIVNLALLGLPKSWNRYQDSVNGGENCHIGNDYGRILGRRRSGGAHEMVLHPRMMMKKFLALVSNGRKGKGKASHFKSNYSHGGKMGDMSKVICFNCHKMGHYATNFPSKKSKKGSSEGLEVKGLAS